MQAKESGMIELTDEQRRQLAQQRGEPVELLDPITCRKYLLIPSETPPPPEPLAGSVGSGQPGIEGVPAGIRRSQEAFRRDLPQLLQDRKLRGQWVAYHGEERIGVARRMAFLTRQCLRRGLQDDQFYVGLIDPSELIEEEEVERALQDHDDSEAGQPGRTAS